MDWAPRSELHSGAAATPHTRPAPRANRAFFQKPLVNRPLWIYIARMNRLLTGRSRPADTRRTTMKTAAMFMILWGLSLAATSALAEHPLI